MSIDLNAALLKLRGFCRKAQRPPSYDEIKDLFEYKSKNAAYWLVNQLIEKGFVRKDSRGKLLIEADGAKLLGTVQAGWPSPAEEELIDTISLDEYLIRHPDQTYLVKAQGDSMIDAGIHEGDLLAVERGRTAQHMDVVIAQVDGEWTLKYYEKKGKGDAVRLLPANKKYSPIVPKNELIIGGVVVGVIRKYK